MDGYFLPEPYIGLTFASGVPLRGSCPRALVRVP